MLWFLLCIVIIGVGVLFYRFDYEIYGTLLLVTGVCGLILALIFGGAIQLSGSSDIIKYHQTREYVESLYEKDITPQERTFVIDKIIDINNNIEETKLYKDDLWRGWPFSYLPVGDLEKLDLTRLNVPLTRVEVIK